MLDRLDHADERAETPSGDDGFASLLRLAARLAETPYAVLEGGGSGRHWRDPALPGPAVEPERLRALCRQLGGSPAVAVVPDARRDGRLRDDPAVAGPPSLRFIASVPVLNRNGAELGTLAVADVQPRPLLRHGAADGLADVARLAAALLERRAEAVDRARIAHEAERRRAAEAAANRAPGFGPALGALLEAACRFNGAVAGFALRLDEAGRAAAPAVLAQRGDGSALATDLLRLAALGPAVAALAQHGGTAARVLPCPEIPTDAPPNLAEAVRRGMRAQLAQPFALGEERFGLVLQFGPGPRARDPVALAEAADNLSALVRAVRPVLQRKTAEARAFLLGRALDHAREAVVITEAAPLGPSGPRIAYANEAFCRATGYTPDEVTGEPYGLLHGPETDRAAVARLRAAMRAGRVAAAELLLYRRDGSAFAAALEFSPVRDPAGHPTHWICVGREAAPPIPGNTPGNARGTAPDDAAFRSLLGNSPLPVLVAARPDGTVLAANAAALAQLGQPRGAVEGHPLAALVGHDVLLADAPGAEHEPAPVTHLRPDGAVAELRAVAHPLVHEGREAVLAVLLDVTEAETARRELRRARDLLQERALLLRARAEELAAVLRLGRLATWRLPVLDGEPAASRELAELAAPGQLHPDDRDAAEAALRAALDGRGPQEFEYRVLGPDGAQRHLRAAVRTLEDEHGGVFELLGCSEDVSERKRTEQALLRNESLRSLGQLTGGVAHDFNNLLTVVILNLEEAGEVLPADHELQQVLAPALHAAVRGAELTGQLLAYARRATLRPERVRPDEFFGALRPLLNRVLGERHELQVLLRHNGGSAMVDPAQLDSAVMNLVINARDAMPGGGTVVLETRSVTLPAGTAAAAGASNHDEVVPGRYVVVAVTDRGHGIPPELLGRVFEPFFTTKEAGQGSGLGLSMVYGFARQSGGHVAIESVRGEGTTVRLFLPVADDAGAPGTDPAAPPEWTAGGLRVLLVEDQDSVLRTVARMLRAMRFTVTEAAASDDALDCLEREPPFDLLFTDIVLPGPVDGLALAEEVRARTPETRILLTSGFTEHVLATDGLDGVDFLMKPYKRQDLQAKFATMFPRPPSFRSSAR